MLADHAGRMQSERVGLKYNRILVEDLYKTYTEANNKKAWVRIAADSPNRQIREAWNLIPQDMKQTAKTYFGEPVLYMHRDDINQGLGYREASIKNLFKPENFDEGTFKRTVSEVLKAVFNPKLINYLRKGELGAQEAVSIAKDVIVVKSAVVPAANIVSNIAQLSLRGIPSEKIYSDILLGINAKREYDETTEKMYVLRAKLKASDDVAESIKLKDEFELLKKSRQDNPLHRLISEEGLNPSVIEELGEESKRDGIRKKFIEGLSAKFEKNLPTDNPYVDVGKEVIMTQDSNVYKLLNEGLELGDFVSKFVLYNHLVETEGVDHVEAVEQARSEFINYNRNQNKTLDYLNKVGGMFFFKYLLRKHPIIINSIKKNPSRALMQVIATAYLGVPSLYETNLINKDWGASTGIVDLISMGAEAHPFL